jgi:hypothetical protein
MRDVLSIRQTEDVLEYAGRFETAKHRVLVHNKAIGEVFFVQKFLDGLRYNIRSAIALHKPRTVDAALSLALMQEEIVEASSRRFTPRARDSRLNFKSAYTPSEATTPVSGAGNTPATADKPNSKPRWDEKLAALRAARKAKGLCMKCGDQYSPQHRCPKQIPIHVLEEVLDLYSLGTSSEEHSDCSSQGSEAEILSLSYCATVGIQGKKTMRLKATIQQQEVLVLIDSGSSGTFINTTVVQQLGLPLQPL